ncbi:hypothetical protein [Vallitalea guaymasensis]|uniref:hypothetical protein n=1 Tax=Vallitalea guaymasensis TaxID=1185412 RepID=UPI00187D463B|nr:hypothetical protein [Vallitalea guaymasensis]
MTEFEYAQVVSKFEEAFGLLRSAYNLLYQTMGSNEAYNDLKKVCEESIDKIKDYY